MEELAIIAKSQGIERPIIHFFKMEMVAETTKNIMTNVGTAKEKESSKGSATTVGNLVIKKPIAGRSIPTRNQLSSRSQEIQLEQILRS